MKFVWILTNIHEQKSHIINKSTLVGSKPYCDIKLYAPNINENDVRFKVRKEKYIKALILRPEISQIHFEINFKPIEGRSRYLYLSNGFYWQIESYLFKVTQLQIPKKDQKTRIPTILKQVTEKVIEEYKKEKPEKVTRPIAKIKPNDPPLAGTYQQGQMIDTNSIAQEEELLPIEFISYTDTD